MRKSLGYSVALALACGPTTGTADGGNGGGASETGGDATADAGVSSAASIGPSSTDGGVASGNTAGDENDASGAGTTGEVGMCVLAIRLDLCCNQPVPATEADLEADECLVRWPLGDVADEVRLTCIDRQPEGCQRIDCTTTLPPSEELALTDEGTCVFVCPEGESIGYVAPGCDFPAPIAACLPPPPPCAMDYCACTGETVLGCSQLGEPYAHEGACE